MTKTSFGNFRANIASGVKTAIVYDDVGQLFDYFRVCDKILEFVDEEVIDTPRLPTVAWCNWAVLQAKLICKREFKNARGVGYQVYLQIDSSRPDIMLNFVHPPHKDVFTIQIMDFILRFLLTNAESYVQNEISNFYANPDVNS